MGDAILVNPEFVLVCGKPCGVGMDSVAVDEEGRRRGLVPDFNVELVFTGRDGVFLNGELELTVYGEIVLAFSGDGDGFLVVERESLRELDGDVV